ncbi:MAG: DUF2807 domain-containing protein [Anaerolineales bacterium]|nr:DUF2807 domain-containing protein [Anaerolineales bacterium]
MRTLVKLVLVILVITAVTTACGIPFQPRMVRGSGDVIVEDRKVSGFDKILVEGAGRLILTQGDSESLSIETDDNLIEYIRTEVVGDTLEIGFEDDVVFSSGKGRVALDPSDGFVFRISVIDLEAISVSGAADIEMDKIKTDRLDITFSGAGRVSVDDLDAGSLNVHVSGAGDVNLVGRVDDQVVMLSGFGRYQAFDLESQEASVTISGAGGANVWVIETLDVSISGAGDVKYYGSPSVNPNISGLGRIQSQGEK